LELANAHQILQSIKVILKQHPGHTYKDPEISNICHIDTKLQELEEREEIGFQARVLEILAEQRAVRNAVLVTTDKNEQGSQSVSRRSST